MYKFKQPNSRHLPWLVLAVILFLSASLNAIAQPGRGGGINPPGGGRHGDDPTDEGVKNAKVNDKAQKLLAEGDRLLGKGDIIRAKSKYRSVIELVGLEGPGQSAFGALENLHQQGMQELERAKGLFEEKNYIEARDASVMVQRQYANLFGGINVGENRPNLAQLAKSLITRIERDPGAKAALQEVKARPMAKKIARYDKQVEKDPTRLYDIYETCAKAAKKYPDCETGKSCAARAKKLKADKKSWKVICEERERRDIRKQLQEIETHEKAGRTAEAKKLLDRLLIKYPGRSREELEKMANTKRPK